MSEPNENRRTWLAPLAISIVCCLAMPAMAGNPTAIEFLVGVAGFMALLAAWLGFGRRLRIRDRYDLSALKEIHELEELRDLDPGVPSGEADRVVCVHCGNEYHTRFPVCPHCGLR